MSHEVRTEGSFFSEEAANSSHFLKIPACPPEVLLLGSLMIADVQDSIPQLFHIFKGVVARVRQSYEISGATRKCAQSSLQ